MYYKHVLDATQISLYLLSSDFPVPETQGNTFESFHK